MLAELLTFGQSLLNSMSWPLAALIFGIVGILVFRQPLSRLLDRTRKLGVGHTGLEADSQPQGVVQQKDAKAFELEHSAAEELQRLFDSALLAHRETLISAQLERLSFRDTTADHL